MARAARLSGNIDEEEQEIEELMAGQQNDEHLVCANPLSVPLLTFVVSYTLSVSVCVSTL